MHLAMKYYLGDLGADCPLNQAVSSAEECRAAAGQLEYSYDNITSRDEKRPLGCYYWSINDSKKFVYFNTMVDSSDIRPINSNSGGVCTSVGMLSRGTYVLSQIT